MNGEKYRKIPLIYGEKIYEGSKMDFYIGLSKYGDEYRLVFFTKNPKTEYVGGLFSIPIDAIPHIYEAIPRVLSALQKELVEGGEK